MPIIEAAMRTPAKIEAALFVCQQLDKRREIGVAVIVGGNAIHFN